MENQKDILILTIIYTNANDLYDALATSSFQFGLTIISALLFLLTLIFSFLAINPNLTNHNKKSVIYFGTIKNYSNNSEYHKTIKELNEEELNEMFSEQIYINSHIAWNKFVKVGWAIRFFSSMILVLFVQILTYIF
jgi:methionine synthase II (cobalamin-independent)